MDGMKICKHCGSMNPETYKFCCSCGSKLEEERSVAEAPAFESEGYTVENQAAEPVNNGNMTETYDTIDILYDNIADPYKGAYAASGADGMRASNGNEVMAIISLTLGIVSLVCCCTWVFSLILGVVAIILGVVVVKNNFAGRSMAIAGIITGGIAVFLFFVMTIMIFSDTAGAISVINNVV